MDLRLPLIMGHRGAAASAPENTLAGLELAKSLGAEGVEFDVMLTADGVAILHHDETFKRTAGRDVPVAQTPWAEARTLDVGRWFGAGFAGQHPPRLSDALGVCRKLGLFVNVEIKPTAGTDVASAQEVCRVLRDDGTADSGGVVVSSFSIECMAAIRDMAPEIPRGWLVRAMPANWRDTARELGCTTIHPGWRGLRAATVAAIHDAGYAVTTWTVNDPKAAQRLARAGVDSIISDVPEKLATALAG